MECDSNDHYYQWCQWNVVTIVITIYQWCQWNVVTIVITVIRLLSVDRFVWPFKS